MIKRLNRTSPGNRNPPLSLFYKGFPSLLPPPPHWRLVSLPWWCQPPKTGHQNLLLRGKARFLLYFSGPSPPPYFLCLIQTEGHLLFKNKAIGQNWLERSSRGYSRMLNTTSSLYLGQTMAPEFRTCACSIFTIVLLAVAGKSPEFPNEMVTS